MSDVADPALSARIARVTVNRPLIRTPDGIPDGWCIYIDGGGVPVLERAKPANQNTVTYRPQVEER